MVKCIAPSSCPCCNELPAYGDLQSPCDGNNAARFANTSLQAATRQPGHGRYATMRPREAFKRNASSRASTSPDRLTAAHTAHATPLARHSTKPAARSYPAGPAPAQRPAEPRRASAASPWRVPSVASTHAACTRCTQLRPRVPVDLFSHVCDCVYDLEHTGACDPQSKE